MDNLLDGWFWLLNLFPAPHCFVFARARDNGPWLYHFATEAREQFQMHVCAKQKAVQMQQPVLPLTDLITRLSDPDKQLRPSADGPAGTEQVTDSMGALPANQKPDPGR